MKTAQTKINAMITQKMIERIKETGTLPWHKPWRSNARRPRNLVSGKPYRGVNAFLLHLCGYESPFWLSLKQVNAAGGRVRKGENSCPVIFWRIVEREDAEDEKQAYALLRYYRVFNASQCEGLKSRRLAELQSPQEQPVLPDAEHMIRHMPDPPKIRYGYRQACYSRLDDSIRMPERSQFQAPEAFYAVLFHELAHATGHEKRLARKSLMESTAFGSETYSLEELTAEMAAGFLCGHCGILPQTEADSAAYLRGWLEKLEAEPELLIRAGCHAQKAFDYVLDANQTTETKNLHTEETTYETLTQKAAA